MVKKIYLGVYIERMDLIIDIIFRLYNIYRVGEEALPHAIGNEPIVKITCAKYPVKLTKILNMLSDKRFEQSIHDYGYEQLSSLQIIINDTYILEKGFRPRIRRCAKPPTGQTVDIDLPTHFMGTTINDFVKETKQHMGEEMFQNYSFTMNNCQHFVWACLVANHLTDDMPDIRECHVDKIVQAWLEKWLSDAIIEILDR